MSKFLIIRDRFTNEANKKKKINKFANDWINHNILSESKHPLVISYNNIIKEEQRRKKDAAKKRNKKSAIVEEDEPQKEQNDDYKKKLIISKHY